MEKVSVPKRGARRSSVDRYLYMTSWEPSLPGPTVCCWKLRTNSANTRRIRNLVRKLSLAMWREKERGMQRRKLQENFTHKQKSVTAHQSQEIRFQFISVTELHIRYDVHDIRDGRMQSLYSLCTSFWQCRKSSSHLVCLATSCSESPVCRAL